MTVVTLLSIAAGLYMLLTIVERHSLPRACLRVNQFILTATAILFVMFF